MQNIVFTYLGQRMVGYLFETNRATRYSPRRIQYIVKETAEQAEITKRVYPHLLRHSVATTLLERGMPIEQIQKYRVCPTFYTWRFLPGCTTHEANCAS